MLKKSKIIVLEGLDGVGKTTQFDLLQKYFVRRGLSFQVLHFPRLHQQPFGPLMQKYLSGQYGTLTDVDPYLITSLFLNDQYWALKTLLFHKKNIILLLDRYYYSTFAYQSALMSAEHFRHFSQWFEDILNLMELPQPCLAICLLVNKTFQHTNLKNRHIDNKDLHENSTTYQEKVLQRYNELLNINWHKLEKLICMDHKNCILSTDEIHKKICTRIDQLFES